MSTSEGSETADSMDDDTSQVSHGRRSKVWEHYEQELVVVEGDPKAVCKYCRGQFHTKFGTSSLGLAVWN
uniref:BED-type domain-containing protein n=1 Tax=Hordeum vulgare subsp. vulgare TaxID=112509 RepID=M0VKL3_HORVV